MNSARVILLGLLSGVSLVLFAAAPVDLDLGSRGILKFVQGQTSPDGIGRFDKLEWYSSPMDKEGQVVFETGGRLLEAMEKADLESNGGCQVLLTLDPGGNGGFKEFSLLMASGTGFAEVWTETLKAGVLTLKDANGDKKTDIVLDGTELDLATGKIASKTLSFDFTGGVVSPIGATKK